MPIQQSLLTQTKHNGETDRKTSKVKTNTTFLGLIMGSNCRTFVLDELL